jgi:hypothetical protein
VIATNTAKFITPRAEVDAPEVTLVGFSNVMHSVFSVSIPPDNEGIILQSLSDFSAGTNSAVVSIDGDIAGRWSHVDTCYSNSTFGWGINEVFLSADMTKGKNRLDLSVDYSAPATEYRFRVLPLADNLKLDGLYQDWIQQFSGLRSFTNLTDNLDGDVYDNFEEYAFGGNPDGIDGYFQTIGAFRKNAEGQLEFTFPKRVDDNLSYSVVYRDDLATGDWSVLEPFYEAVGNPVDGLSMVTNTAPIDEHGFFRLQVERP